MNKKDIKKIIIPAIAIVVVIGWMLSYFTKTQEAQPVMAPIDTQQSLVEDKEKLPEEPIEDTTTDNNEVKIVTETEETAIDDGINSTHTDITLGDNEYKGDNGNDALQNSYNNLTEERQQEVDAALKRAKERHPDWFQDDNSGNTGNTKAPGYVSVDAPVDNGELPGEFDMSGHSGVAAGTVY